MMYPFLTLDDETEITHSEWLPSGEVKVYVEKPDAQDCFHHLTCYFPGHRIAENVGFAQDEVDRYLEIIRSEADAVMNSSRRRIHNT